MTFPIIKRDSERPEEVTAVPFGRADLDIPCASQAGDRRWSTQRMLAVSAIVSVVLWAFLGLLIWEGVHAFGLG